MTERHQTLRPSALGRLWAAAHLHWRGLMTRPVAEHRQDVAHVERLMRCRSPWVRRFVYAGAGFGSIALLATGLLWWRLASGPLALDVITPWLTSAIEQRFGGR